MNPMLQMLKPQSQANPGNGAMPVNNPMQMMQQFAQFKNLMRGRNPEAMVNELIRKGEMTPEQLEQLKQQAQSLAGILS